MHTNIILKNRQRKPVSAGMTRDKQITCANVFWMQNHFHPYTTHGKGCGGVVAHCMQTKYIGKHGAPCGHIV